MSNRRRRRNREDWRTAVLCAKCITDSTRVLLLVMYEYVKPDMTVSVPRYELAQILDRSERRISERVAAAQDAGFLGKDPIVRGQKGRTAVYACLFPDVQGAANRHPEQTSKGARNRHPEKAVSVTDGGPTTNSATCLPERSLLTRVPNEGHLGEQWLQTATEVTRSAVPGWDREESA